MRPLRISTITSSIGDTSAEGLCGAISNSLTSNRQHLRHDDAPAAGFSGRDPARAAHDALPITFEDAILSVSAGYRHAAVSRPTVLVCRRQRMTFFARTAQGGGHSFYHADTVGGPICQRRHGRAPKGSGI